MKSSSKLNHAKSNRVWRRPGRRGHALFILVLVLASLVGRTEIYAVDVTDTFYGIGALAHVTTGVRIQRLVTMRSIRTPAATPTRPAAVMLSSPTTPAALTRPAVILRSLLTPPATPTRPAVRVPCFTTLPATSTRPAVLMRSTTTARASATLRMVLVRSISIQPELPT